MGERYNRLHGWQHYCYATTAGIKPSPAVQRHRFIPKYLRILLFPQRWDKKMCIRLGDKTSPFPICPLLPHMAIPLESLKEQNEYSKITMGFIKDLAYKDKKIIWEDFLTIDVYSTWGQEELSRWELLPSSCHMLTKAECKSSVTLMWQHINDARDWTIYSKRFVS